MNNPAPASIQPKPLINQAKTAPDVWRRATWQMAARVCACAVLALLASAAHAELVLRYTFDDVDNATFAEDSGAVPLTNGIFVGAVSRTNDTPSGSGAALDLTAPGNVYVNVGDPAKLNNLTNLTITFWLRLTNAMVASADRIIDKTHSTAAASGGFGLRSTANGRQLTFGINSTTASGPLSPDIPTTNVWTFLAVTYDGTKSNLNIQWFQGGLTNAVVGAGLATHAGWAGGALPNNPNANFRIGGTTASTGDRTAPAIMDDVRVFNHVLSPVEIESIRREASNLPAEPSILTFTANGASGVSLPQSTYVTGGSNIVLSAAIAGAGPLSAQLYYNNLPIPGAATVIGGNVGEFNYLLSGGVPDYAGAYEVVVTNSLGSVSRQISSLEVTTIFDSTVMSNLWTVAPGSRDYLAASGAQTRSMTYNPGSVAYPDRGSLILARWGNASTKFVQLLDPATGDTGPTLATTDGESIDMTIGNRGINAVAAAEDGAFYVCNVVISATNIPFHLYRYASDDSATVLPTLAYSGDPGGANYPGLRWGDNLAARGTGAGTQILIAPGGGTNYGPLVTGNRVWETNIVALLQTADGLTFTSQPILITNAPADFAALGVAFGPGTNTFFGKNALNKLFLVEFDASSGIGWVKHASELTAVPASVVAIGTDPSRQRLAALSLETPDNVRLYHVADVTRDAELVDQAAFETNNDNPLNGGLGAAVFGTNTVFVLNCNNGVKAFTINTNYAQPPSFTITDIAPQSTPGVAAISWPTEAGRTYQVQSRGDVATGGWARAGVPVMGSGATAIVTNLLLTGNVTNRFYRVVGQ